MKVGKMNKTKIIPLVILLLLITPLLGMIPSANTIGTLTERFSDVTVEHTFPGLVWMTETGYEAEYWTTITYKFTTTGDVIYWDEDGNELKLPSPILPSGVMDITLYQNTTHVAINYVRAHPIYPVDLWFYYDFSVVDEFGYTSKVKLTIIVEAYDFYDPLKIMLENPHGRSERIEAHRYWVGEEDETGILVTGVGFDWSDAVDFIEFGAPGRILKLYIETGDVVDPVTVGTTSSSLTFTYNFQRRSFRAASLFWIFYSNETDVVWRTSIFGDTWSSATILLPGEAMGQDWSIWYDGTYMYYVHAQGSTTVYRRGQPIGAGTITWSAAESEVIDDFIGAPNICVDDNGYPWVGYRNYTNTRAHTITSSTKDTWTTAANFPKDVSGAASTYVAFAPLTGGDMYVVWSHTFEGGVDAYLKGRLYNGTWQAIEDVFQTMYFRGAFTVVRDASDVHVAFLSKSQTLVHMYRDSGGSWSAQIPVMSGVTTTTYPILARDNTGDRILCFWMGSPLSEHIYYGIFNESGLSWSSYVDDPVDWVSDTIIHNYAFTVSERDFDSVITLFYLSDPPAPYLLRYISMSTVLESTVPDGLRAEGQVNPSWVEDLTPELSAVTHGMGAQYAQIQVGTVRYSSNMWDSGWIYITDISDGERCGDISYAGTGLTTDGSKYWWQIRFREGTTDGSWSEVEAYFIMTTSTVPDSLLCEGEAHPTDVSDLTPEFSAICRGMDITHAYIQVGTSIGVSDKWDSGWFDIPDKVDGQRCDDISYSGPALALDGSKYYWRIKFRDTGVEDGDYSTVVATFIMRGERVPDTLLCEGYTNPTYIMDTTPEFSAMSYGLDATHAYIQVGISVGTSNMWNSGWIDINDIGTGERCQDISYDGYALEEDGTVYYWRIKFKEDSVIEGEYSTETATFSVFTMTEYTFYATINDGYIYKNSETYLGARNAGSGAVAINDNLWVVGQNKYDAGYQVIRGVVYFDTSDLPEDAIITSAWFMLYGANDFSGVDFNVTILGGSTAEYPHDPAYETDYNASYIGTTSYGIYDTRTWIITGYNAFTVTQAGLDSINKAGITKWYLRSSRDISATGPTADERIVVWSSTEGEPGDRRPKLVVTWITAKTPIDLKCEGEENPVDVSDITPEFTANCTGIAATHAYILVGTTVGASDMWYSGWIDIADIGVNTICAPIPYAGTALTREGDKYYWRIKFKGAAGEGDWSVDVTTFTMDDITPNIDDIKLDFGTNTSPLEAGWTRLGVTNWYDSTLGYGWNESVSYRDSEVGNDLQRDNHYFAVPRSFIFHTGTNRGTFNVRILVGGGFYSQSGVFIIIDDKLMIEDVTLAGGEWQWVNRSVFVNDPFMTIAFDATGAEHAYRIAGIEIDYITEFFDEFDDLSNWIQHKSTTRIGIEPADHSSAAYFNTTQTWIGDNMFSGRSPYDGTVNDYMPAMYYNGTGAHAFSDGTIEFDLITPEYGHPVSQGGAGRFVNGTWTADGMDQLTGVGWDFFLGVTFRMQSDEEYYNFLMRWGGGGPSTAGWDWSLHLGNYTGHLPEAWPWKYIGSRLSPPMSGATKYHVMITFDDDMYYAYFEYGDYEGFDVVLSGNVSDLDIGTWGGIGFCLQYSPVSPVYIDNFAYSNTVALPRISDPVEYYTELVNVRNSTACNLWMAEFDYDMVDQYLNPGIWDDFMEYTEALYESSTEFFGNATDPWRFSEDKYYLMNETHAIGEKHWLVVQPGGLGAMTLGGAAPYLNPYSDIGPAMGTAMGLDCFTYDATDRAGHFAGNIAFLFYAHEYMYTFGWSSLVNLPPWMADGKSPWAYYYKTICMEGAADLMDDYFFLSGASAQNIRDMAIADRAWGVQRDNGVKFFDDLEQASPGIMQKAYAQHRYDHVGYGYCGNWYEHFNTNPVPTYNNYTVRDSYLLMYYEYVAGRMLPWGTIEYATTGVDNTFRYRLNEIRRLFDSLDIVLEEYVDDEGLTDWYNNTLAHLGKEDASAVLHETIWRDWRDGYWEEAETDLHAIRDELVDMGYEFPEVYPCFSLGATYTLEGDEYFFVNTVYDVIFHYVNAEVMGIRFVGVDMNVTFMYNATSGTWDKITELSSSIKHSDLLLVITEYTVGPMGENDLEIDLTFTDSVYDMVGVDLYMYCLNSYYEDPWRLIIDDMFDIYNVGGGTEYTFGGDGASIVGGDIFEIQAGTAGSWAQASVSYRKIQHVHLMFSLDTSDDWDSGRKVFVCPTDDQYTGSVEYGISYLDPSNIWVEGWKVIIDIADGNVGHHGTGEDHSWVKIRVRWYQKAVLIKTDYIFTYHWGYTTADEGGPGEYTVMKFWLDLWFNELEGSSVVAGRVTAYWHGMREYGNAWWFGYGKFRPILANVTQSMFSTDLLDFDGDIISAQRLDLMKIRAKITKTGCSHLWMLRDFDIFDIKRVLPPTGNMKGIPTPSSEFQPPQDPSMPMGGFLGGLVGAIGRLGENIITGITTAALGMWKYCVGFMDAIFTYFGYGNFFSLILSTLASFYGFFIVGLVMVVDMLTQLFIIIPRLFGFLLSIFTGMVSFVILLFGHVGSILDGTNTAIGGLTNVWKMFGFEEWFSMTFLSLILFLQWMSSLDDRNRKHGGWFGYFIDDCQKIMWGINWIFDMALGVADFFIGLLFRVVEAIPGIG